MLCLSVCLAEQYPAMDISPPPRWPALSQQVGMVYLTLFLLGWPGCRPQSLFSFFYFPPSLSLLTALLGVKANTRQAKMETFQSRNTGTPLLDLVAIGCHPDLGITGEIPDPHPGTALTATPATLKGNPAGGAGPRSRKADPSANRLRNPLKK